MYYAIDPGTTGLAVVVADDVEIVQAFRFKRPKGESLGTFARNCASAIREGRRVEMHTAYVEHMQIRNYTGAKARAIGQDLIDIQAVACILAGHLAPDVQLITPNEWKGSVPKYISHKRILQALTPAETLGLDALGLTDDPNVLDACGIMRYARGRMTR